MTGDGAKPPSHIQAILDGKGHHVADSRAEVVVQGAVRAGKITASEAPKYRAMMASNPIGTEQLLGMMVSMSGGVAGLAAAGAVSRIPQVTASPPTPRAYANAVEEIRSHHPELIAAALADVPAPELFPGSGDYPQATASGIDPAALAGLPWRARLAAAWEGNRVAAFRITQDFGGPGGDIDAFGELGGHPAVTAYVNAVMNWFATAGIGDPATREPVTDEELAPLFGRAAAHAMDPQQTGGPTRPV